jgi:dephospho-CoA kinase
MPLPVQVGITGGIGSGKSTVVKIFACLGIPTYDADSRAKILMSSDAQLIKQIKDEFGVQSYQDGQLNRRYLADHVFGNPDKLNKLNSYVHPKVADDYFKWVTQNKNSKYIIKEAALLYESGSAKMLNKIIVVTAPEPIRIDRIMRRDNRSKREVMNIIKRQFPQEKLQSLADYIIFNDESELLIPQVLNIHQALSVR